MRFVAFLICLMVLTDSYAKSTPSKTAMPITAPLPKLPDGCAGQPTIAGDTLRFITLSGVIDWKGHATQVQVQSPSDQCLQKKMIEAVRNWKFEPVEPGTKEYWRQGFTTTITYSGDQEPRFKIHPYSDVKRIPPRYPSQCLAKGRPAEIVAATFDVNTEGMIENIKIVKSTFRCLNKAAIKSIKKWRYRPRIIDGTAYPRKDIYTEITFELTDDTHSPRSKIAALFLSIAYTIDRKLDPRIALEKIASVEKQFTDILNREERATLLKYRGAAKIDAVDFNGALADLQASLPLVKKKSSAKDIKTVIRQLESAISTSNDFEPESSNVGQD